MTNLTDACDNPNTDKDVIRFCELCREYVAKVGSQKITLHHAVDALQNFAVGRDLIGRYGQDFVQGIMSQAFRTSRDRRK